MFVKQTGRVWRLFLRYFPICGAVCLSAALLWAWWHEYLFDGVRVPVRVV